MAAALHVPEELVEDILSRVPTKSLLRLKTASKNWYSLISQDDKFANFHLKQSKNLNTRFFQVSPFRGTIFQSVNVDTNASCTFNFPGEIERECQLVGSANGLVCIAPCYTGGCFIWNPCTGQCTNVYVPVAMASSSLNGFGYDSSSDDYKIVADWDSMFRVFSLKTNSWKVIDYAFPFQVRANACQFNGALHWYFARNIVAFDFAKEVFSYIELPDEFKGIIPLGYARCFGSLSEYQGFLCILWGQSIWAMKKYGDGKSLVKLSTFLQHGTTPIGIFTLGEVVYQAKGGSGFVKSDIQGRMSDDDKSRINSLSQSVFVYKESLISPSACSESPKRQ